MSGKPREVVVEGPAFELRAVVLDSFFLRLRGLLGTRRGGVRARPVLIVPCPSIHTCAMGYPIDVAMLDGQGRVIRARRSMPPWRLLGCKGAAMALERPSSPGPWPDAGDVLRFRDG